MNQQGNLQQFLNNVRDPKQQVMTMIQKMSPDKRQSLMAMLPKAGRMANKFGINNFEAIANEIKTMM